MSPWQQALREGGISGSLASITSAVALLALAWRKDQHPAAPVNAVSHWVWGDPALRRDDPSLRHTLLGYLIHHAASMFWGVLHARTWGRRPEARRAGPALAGAAATAAAACFVDYRMTPRRLTPGFEHRLNRPEMAAVYACFALGLAAASLVLARRRRSSLRYR